MTLYHYTCRHFVDQIARDGYLRPNPVTGLVWLTDLDVPDRRGLGLTSTTLDCDRLEACFQAEDGPDLEALRWVDVRRDYEPALRSALEGSPGALPMHWWVSRSAVQVKPAQGRALQSKSLPRTPQLGA